MNSEYSNIAPLPLATPEGWSIVPKGSILVEGDHFLGADGRWYKSNYVDIPTIGDLVYIRKNKEPEGGDNARTKDGKEDRPEIAGEPRPALTAFVIRNKQLKDENVQLRKFIECLLERPDTTADERLTYDSIINKR